MRINALKRPASAAIAGLTLFAGIHVASPVAQAYEASGVTPGQADFSTTANELAEVDKNLELRVVNSADKKTAKISIIFNQHGGRWGVGYANIIGLPKGVTINGPISRKMTAEKNVTFDSTSWEADNTGDNINFEDWTSALQSRKWVEAGTDDFKKILEHSAFQEGFNTETRNDGPYQQYAGALQGGDPLQGFLRYQFAAVTSVARMVEFEVTYDEGVEPNDLWWVANITNPTLTQHSQHVRVQGPIDHDGDGFSDLDEVDAGTDWKDKDSYPDNGGNGGGGNGGNGGGGNGSSIDGLLENITGGNSSTEGSGNGSGGENSNGSDVSSILDKITGGNGSTEGSGGDSNGSDVSSILDKITGGNGSGGENSNGSSEKLQQCLKDGSSVSVSNPLLWLLPLGLLAFIPVPPQVGEAINNVFRVPPHLNINTYIPPEVQRGLLGAGLIAAALAGFGIAANVGCDINGNGKDGSSAGGSLSNN